MVIKQSHIKVVGNQKHVFTILLCDHGNDQCNITSHDLLYPDFEYPYQSENRPVQHKKVNLVFDGVRVVYDDTYLVAISPPLCGSDVKHIKTFLEAVMDWIICNISKSSVAVMQYLNNITKQFIDLERTRSQKEACALSEWILYLIQQSPKEHEKTVKSIKEFVDILQWYYTRVELSQCIKNDCRRAKVEHGFTKNEMVSIINVAPCYRSFRENPYTVYTTRDKPHKVRFSHLDKLAIYYKTPLDVRATENVAHAIMHAMDEEGHTCYPKNKLVHLVLELAHHRHRDFTKEHIAKMIENTDRFRMVDDDVYLPFTYYIERDTADRLQEYINICHDQSITKNRIPQELNIDAMIEEYEQTGIKLNPKQKRAVIELFTKHNMYVVTGLPGTGKSAIASCIQHIAGRVGCKLLMCAPTGKAANRLGSSAMTIHRALKCVGDPVTGKVSFAVNDKTPFDYDIVLVDESSMLDAHIFHSLLKACVPQRTKLILCGDKQQLPSVNYGDILRNILQCHEIPNVELTKIYRQGKGSSICKLAKMVSTGEVSRSILKSEDVEWIQEQDANKIMEHVSTIVKKHEYKAQILAPGKRGNVGTHELNGLVHKVLYPASFSEQQYQVGEKVVCVKNLYARSGSEIDIDKSAFNGEIGVVQKLQGKTGYTVKFENGKEIDVEKEHLDLAYCLTIHKSQGSEYDAVILVLNKYHDIMLNNELVYTAMTRAKTKLYIISCDYCILKSVKTPAPKRFSNISKMVNRKR